MADSYILTDGTTSYELQYNASSQATYKALYGHRIGSSEKVAVWHTPVDGPRELIHLNDDVRTAYLNLNVDPGAIDDVLDAIVDINRLLDQAARYSLMGDTDRVTLNIQLNGATNTTQIPIIYGRVMDDDAHYQAVSRVNDMAYGVVIELYLEPYGEGSSVTLANYIQSSPHAVEDSDGDGLADSWTAVNSPTFQMYTADYLIGGSCLRMNSTGASDAVYTRTTIGSGADLAAYVWLRPITSNVTVTLRSNNGANVIDTAVLTPTDGNSVSDKTATSAAGTTWYRVPLSGSAGAGHTNAEIRITAAAGNPCLIDGAYMITGTTTVPDMWMSARQIDNRNDPTNAAPGQINYIDTWGIPGDAPALVNYAFDWTAITGTPALMYAGRVEDGAILAADITGWIESGDFGTPLSTNATWGTGTGTSDNEYIKLTSDNTGTGTGQKSITISGDAARQLLTKPMRVFGRCRSSDTAATFRVTVSPPGGAVFTSDRISNDTAAQWEIIDFGLLNAQGKASLNPPDTDYPDVDIYLSIASLPSGSNDTIYFDALLFIPTDEFMVVDFFNTFSTSNTAHIRGQYRDTIIDIYGVDYASRLGTLWELAPGQLMNRTRYVIVNRTTNLWTLTDAANVVLTVIPRSRHLLGVK